jgi:sugar phosphate isomerase/epimerase
VAPGLPLLELGPELRARNYESVQICHFQLPTRDPSYLDELSSSLRESGVAMDALLVDDGDLTAPSEADAHQRWIEEWVEDGVRLGAARARVIAGKQTPTPGLLHESADRLRQIAAAHPSIRIVTENWFSLLSAAQPVDEVVGRTEGSVGFLLDFGNWKGADKYSELEAVASYAESCHAKCHFVDDVADKADFERVLGILAAADYTGELTLVYDSENDSEWDRLEVEWAMVPAYFP